MSTAATVTRNPDDLIADARHSVSGGLPAFGSRRSLDWREMLEAPVRWPRPSRLQAPLEVPQAGKLAEGLRALGLTSVGALLEHLPRDSREARTVAALKTGGQAAVAVQ